MAQKPPATATTQKLLSAPMTQKSPSVALLPQRESIAPIVTPSIITAPGPALDVVHHGSPQSFAYGGSAALRFAQERVAGVSNPDWLSVLRVGGFAALRIQRRVVVAADAAYDRSTRDFTLERAKLDVRIGARTYAHAGLLLPPLGRANLQYDAPRGEFTERSLVARELVGVPSSQLGAGIRGFGRLGPASIFSYEADVVTGYDQGILTDSPEGTRLPAGRAGLGNEGGAWGLAGRVAMHMAGGTEVGLAAIGGPYNQPEVNGVEVDRSRYVVLAVADGATRLMGFRMAGEAGFASIDVPPALEGPFAERQWGGSVEVARTIAEPVFGGTGSSLSAAVRADAVDFDLSVPGDSRSRLATSLNLRPWDFAVFRLGWFYEIRRDRFNNDVPTAGATLILATYF